MALLYFLAGILSCITIIGIGNGIQSFKLAGFALSPFGKHVEPVPDPAAGGCLAMIANVIWFIVGGVWLAIGHIFWAILFTILIVTIPFAKQHFEMAHLALAPFGKQIVED